MSKSLYFILGGLCLLGAIWNIMVDGAVQLDGGSSNTFSSATKAFILFLMSAGFFVRGIQVSNNDKE